MSEQIPTPSSEFSKHSHRQDIIEGTPHDERKYNEAEAQVAGEAAKPFVDAATEVFEAAKKGSMNGREENVIDTYPGLSELIGYAERRVRSSALKGEAPKLTEDEQSALAVYKAAAEHEQALADFGADYDSLSIVDVLAASAEAGDRFTSATTREEKKQWGDMERKLERYGSYIRDSNEIEPGEFSADTSRVGGLLGISNPETGSMNWEGAVKAPRQLLLDAHNLRENAGMLHFLGNRMRFEKQERKIAAAREQVSRLNTRSSGEKMIFPDSHNPHFDIVDSLPEAKELIYSNSAYLRELVDESEAYAKFSAERLDTSQPVISNLKTMERDLPELRQIMQEWQSSKQGMDFKQYIEAIVDGDIDIPQEQLLAAQSAKNLLRNTLWREAAMARRMNRKITDKSEASDAAKEFGLRYFQAPDA